MLERFISERIRLEVTQSAAIIMAAVGTKWQQDKLPESFEIEGVFVVPVLR